jgi:hypothetical protein
LGQSLSFVSIVSHPDGMVQNNYANDGGSAATGENDGAKHRVVLPRFIVRNPVGAGQVVKRVASAVGVKPCAGCEQRAAGLDRWLRIEPRD